MPELTTDFTLYRDALFADDAALVLWSPDTGEEALDNASSSAFGKTLEAVVRDRSFSTFGFIAPDDRENVRAAAEKLLEGLNETNNRVGRYSTECHFLASDGVETWCDLHFVARVGDGGARQVLVVFRNDEKDHQVEEELRSRADFDAMTGVYNKRRTAELIEKYLSSPGSRGSLIIFDLDNFKAVNDTLGHLVGDAVISDMALCLKSAFRESDVIGRVGGDEFVVYATGTNDAALIEDRAEKARAKIGRTLKCADGTLTLTCSAGVAYAPADGTDYNRLFEHADAALYHAKNSGKNLQAHYATGMKMSELEPAQVDSDTVPGASLPDSPVEFIFQMLFETRDVETTTELLLGLAGKYFDVQRVFVYHRLPDMSWTCFFDWHDESVAPPYVAHEGIVTDFINMNYRRTPTGLYSELNCPDDTAPEVCSVLKERGIHAFLHAGIMDGDDKFGCVGMDDCVNDRQWTDHERLVLRAFADILGSFLVQRANETEKTDSHAHLRDVLESIERPIFITDPDDGALLFANGCARERYGIPLDFSSSGTLPVGHEGFLVTWRDGRSVDCHVLAASEAPTEPGA